MKAQASNQDCLKLFNVSDIEHSVQIINDCKMISLSIVMAYFKRHRQLRNTLLSIQKQTCHKTPFEVVIVDDGSEEDFSWLKQFNFKIILVNIDPKKKKHINPCVPFNLGFAYANGSKILVQNPECYHYDDIILKAMEVKLDNNYIAFSCYSLSQKQTELLNDNFKFEFKDNIPKHDGDEGWYNHKYFRPTNYHFCSLIEKSKLTQLRGFDQRFASGRAYDDDEFLFRIKEHGIKVFTSDCIVMHQWHYSSPVSKPTFEILRNRFLLALVIRRKLPYCIFNILENLRFSRFSFFQFLDIVKNVFSRH